MAAVALNTPALDLIIEQMDDRLADFAVAGDRRERFLLMYRTFKGELRRNLQAGRFRDLRWSEAICCRMGEMYFEADVAYEQQPGECPEPWTHAFEGSRRRRTNLLQGMLLGMNAHINYDLPLCTFDTMTRFGDVEELRQGGETSLRFRQLLRRRYHDFLLINEVAWESIPLIQDVVCERFNWLLKYANILSFRFSRPIAERIICEYRDRAWAHTLVLITSAGDQDATRYHLSRFALRAAKGVERLTLNPLRHLRPAAVATAGSTSIEPVAQTLVEHLGRRPTREIARQALIEYGEEVQPVLIRTLAQTPPRVRAELYQILGAHPTAAAVGALADAILWEREARARLLNVLAGMEVGPRREAMREPLMQAAREELAQGRRLLTLAAALGPEEQRGSLLDQALRSSTQRSLSCARDALQAAGRSLTLEPPDKDDFRRGVPSLDALLQGMRVVATAMGASPLDPDPPSRKAAVDHLMKHPDPWIRASAAWWAGRDRACEAALVGRVQEDDHELVRETALRALSQLLPEERARKVAGGLVRRPADRPGAPAQVLAAQILEGEVTMITTIEKVLHLKNVELFQDILAEDLVPIARVAQEHRFAAKDRLIRKQEPGVAAYVIVRGMVDVRGLDGQVLASVGPGGVLGEMSVISDMPTSANCIATTKGLALRIAREDFHALIQDHPSTAIGVMHVLAERLRRANRRAMDASTTTTSA